MSIETDIYTKLAASTAQTGLPATKIYQNQLPFKVALPGITYYRVATNPVHAMGSDATLRESWWQFNCYSTSPAEASTIAEGLITTLRDFSGQLVGSATGVTVQRIFLDDKRSFEETDPETRKVRYFNAVDFVIWSTEG